MAVVRCALTRFFRPSSWIIKKSSLELLPPICTEHLLITRNYRGSNRYKRMRAESLKLKMDRRLENEFGITDKFEFNFNEWMKSNYFKELEAFQNRIGVVFKDTGLLISAFTHSSFREEVHNLQTLISQKDISDLDLQDRFQISTSASDIASEKLALLGFNRTMAVMKECLYRMYTNLTPSICGDICNFLSSRETITLLSKNIGVEEFLLLSKELENMKEINDELHLEFTKEDILCDAFFALIGAIEKDLGIHESIDFIKDFIMPLIYHTDLSLYVKLENPQEELAKILSLHGVDSVVKPRTIAEAGVDSHFPFYFSGIYCKEKKIGEGSGYSAYHARNDAFRNTIFNCLEGEVDFQSLKKYKK